MTKTATQSDDQHDCDTEVANVRGVRFEQTMESQVSVLFLLLGVRMRTLLVYF